MKKIFEVIYSFSYNYRLLFWILFFVFFIYQPISHISNGKKREFKYKIFKTVIDSLISRGVDSETIFSLINDSRTYFDEKYAKINVLYQPKLSLSEVFGQRDLRKINKFIDDNYQILNKAEEKFSVPKEIIAIILWVETKFGNVLGRNHVPSVFLSMASAGNPILLGNLMRSYNYSGLDKDSLYLVVSQKAKRKQEYAIKELISLIEIHNRGLINIKELYGSFSGAFGIPQFIPSSYLKFGFDGNGDNKVDLFDMDDAIFSVANYLSLNGWNPNDTSSFYPTLFKYNRSDEYVRSILFAYSELKKMRTKIH